jgi:hypothetical protein
MKAQWLGAGLLAASVLAVPAASQAQDWRRDDRYRNDDNYRGRGYRNQAFELGRSRGYSDGAKRGERDARSHRGFDFRREGDYRDADNGYRSSHGPRWEYSRGYRDGYEDGYRQSYRRYARFDRNNRWDRGDRRW